jgi:hypothetical protein
MFHKTLARVVAAALSAPRLPTRALESAGGGSEQAGGGSAFSIRGNRSSHSQRGFASRGGGDAPAAGGGRIVSSLFTEDGDGHKTEHSAASGVTVVTKAFIREFCDRQRARHARDAGGAASPQQQSQMHSQEQGVVTRCVGINLERKDVVVASDG